MKHSKLIVFSCLFISVFGQAVYAVTYQVTISDDPVPDGCLSNDCSLREAVIAANTNPGIDTVVLISETYQLTLQGLDEFAMVGDLDITDDLIMQGDGIEFSTIDGALLAERIFDIKFGTDLHMEDMAVINAGSITGFGGAVRVNEASLQLTRVLLSDNSARRGAGIYATFSTVNLIDSYINGNQSGDEGGAVFLFEGHLSLQSSYIINNISSSFGGGIYAGFTQSDANVPNVTVNDSYIVANVAQNYGGGLSLNSSAQIPIEIEIINTLIWNNQALAGGGISQFGSMNTSVEASSFYANKADKQSQYDNNGGAVNINSNNVSGVGAFSVFNSLLAENTALDYGGAVWGGGTAEILLQNTTISGNSAPACGALCAFGASVFNLIHTTVIKNDTTHDGEIFLTDNSTSTFTDNIFSTDCTIDAVADVISQGGNIESPDDTCGLGSGTNDIIGLHPRFLGLNTELGNYGGPTQTHIINKAYSPAIGNAVVLPAITTDQRYFARDNQPDSGATEQHPHDIDLIFKNKFEEL